MARALSHTAELTRRVLRALHRSLARVAPTLAERLALAHAVAAVLRQRLAGRRVGVVLLYHRIGQTAGDPRRELVPAVALDDFRVELRWLARLFDLVSAADILEAAAARTWGGRIPAAVTFDDEWPTHLELAVPELRRAGVPATFFFTGATLDGATPFWWEVLQAGEDLALPVSTLLDGGDVHERAEAMKRLAPAVRDRLTERLLHLGAVPSRSGMSEEAVRSLADEFDVGFHTLCHDLMTALEPEALRASLVDGRSRLEAAVQRPLDILAYPHGGATRREADAARQAGFRRGYVTSGVGCTPADDPLLISRVEPGPVPLSVWLRALARSIRAAPRTRPHGR